MTLLLLFSESTSLSSLQKNFITVAKKEKFSLVMRVFKLKDSSTLYLLSNSNNKDYSFAVIFEKLVLKCGNDISIILKKLNNVAVIAKQILRVEVKMKHLTLGIFIFIGGKNNRYWLCNERFNECLIIVDSICTDREHLIF
jgi:predicted CDP-diglyceride synthetase/phosphatidate cytidylyltransferase